MAAHHQFHPTIPSELIAFIPIILEKSPVFGEIYSLLQISIATYSTNLPDSLQVINIDDEMPLPHC